MKNGLIENGEVPVVEIPAWKRVLDVALLIMALPLLLPVMVFIACLIRLVSVGPILFKQERIGRGGKPFMCYKFRTMVANDASVHRGHLEQLINSDKPMVKMDVKDSRIIRFGVPLRASGLDELPQLLNVLRGEMSLVGPRPCVRYEYERYLPRQKARFATLPGLTGLWQVSGKNRTTFEEMIELDIKYARTMSLGRDCWIILKTVPALGVQMIETRRLKRETARKSRSPEAPTKTINIGTEFSGVLQTDRRR